MKTTLTIIVTLLLALVLLSPLVSAERNGDRKDDPWEKPHGPDKTIKGDNRLLQYRIWDNGITVTSEGKDHGQFNSFHFTLKLEEGVFMHYNYFRTSFSERTDDYHERFMENRTFPEKDRKHPPPREGGGSQFEMGSVEDLGFSILIRDIREFNESNGRISVYDLATTTFKKPMVDPIVEDDEVIGLKIRTGTEDGIFGLTFYIVSTAEFGQERGISPFEVKYDIAITDYQFNAHDSFLALKNIFAFPEMVLEEPGDRKFDDKPLPPDWTPPPKERTLGYDLDTLSVFFSWATNVTVEGEDHNVTAEYMVSVEGDSTMVEGMTFIYPQGQSILHDPKIGVADLLVVAEDATEFIELLISWSTGLGIGVILIAAVAIRMKPAKFDWED